MFEEVFIATSGRCFRSLDRLKANGLELEAKITFNVADKVVGDLYCPSTLERSKIEEARKFLQYSLIYD